MEITIFLLPSWTAVVTGNGQKKLEEQVAIGAMVLRLIPMAIAMLPGFFTVLLPLSVILP